jgi:hypothetical protein
VRATRDMSSSVLGLKLIILLLISSAATGCLLQPTRMGTRVPHVSMKLSRNNLFKRATANGVAVRGGFGAEPEKRGKTPTKKVEVFLLKDDPIVSKGKAGEIVCQPVSIPRTSG